MISLDVLWLLYLQDHGCYCKVFYAYRCDLFQRFMISGCLESFLSDCLIQLANKQYKPLALQLVCNHGNHSVAIRFSYDSQIVAAGKIRYHGNHVH